MCIDGKYILAIRISTWILNFVLLITYMNYLSLSITMACFVIIFPHNHPKDLRNPFQSIEEFLASPSLCETMTT